MLVVHGSPGSPFASRVIAQLYAKAMEFELRPPGFGTPEWTRLNPLAKMPVLEHDGFILPESAVIAEYLEDAFPDPSLLPEGAQGRACARLITRTVDLYCFGVNELARASMDPSHKIDEAKVRAELARGLGALEAFVGEDGFAVGDRLSTADCAVIGWFFYARMVLEREGMMDSYPRLKRYTQALTRHELTERVWAEMDESFRRFLARFQAAGRGEAMRST